MDRVAEAEGMGGARPAAVRRAGAGGAAVPWAVIAAARDSIPGQWNVTFLPQQSSRRSPPRPRTIASDPIGRFTRRAARQARQVQLGHLQYPLPQQNLWGDSGSGSRPKL